MSSSSNDTNPYAAPVPVEEDVPSFDLWKIARLYNRFGVLLKWFTLLFAIWIPAVVCIGTVELASSYDFVLFFWPAMATIGGFATCLFFPTHFALIILGCYSVFVSVPSVFTLKYSGPLARPLMILGAISFPITLFIMLRLRDRAKQILSTAGIEIINGKVDLAKIPVENDY